MELLELFKRVDFSYFPQMKVNWISKIKRFMKCMDIWNKIYIYNGSQQA